MTKLNWRDASKELPDDTRNVVVKVINSGITTKDYDFYDFFNNEWSCNKESDGSIVVEWIDLSDIPD